MAAAAPLSSEPKTPLWLTCLGAGLFFLVGLFLVFRSPLQPRPERSEKEKPAAAPAAAGSAVTAPTASANGRLDPAALRRLNDRLKQAPPAGSH